MRKSKYDPLVFFVLTGIVLYYFFTQGFYYETFTNPAYDPPVEEILMVPGQVIYGSFFAIIFFLLYVYGDDLEKVPKIKVLFRNSIKNFKKAIHDKVEEGKRLNREYFENRKK